MPNIFTSIIKLVSAVTLAVAVSFATAGSQPEVSWSVTVGSSHPAPAVYAPPPVVYVQPQPVYVRPAPVHVRTVVVESHGHAHRKGHGKGKHRHGRHHRHHH